MLDNCEWPDVHVGLDDCYLDLHERLYLEYRELYGNTQTHQHKIHIGINNPDLKPKDNHQSQDDIHIGINSHYLETNINNTMYQNILFLDKQKDTSACCISGVILGVTTSMLALLNGITNGMTIGTYLLIALTIICLVMLCLCNASSNTAKNSCFFSSAENANNSWELDSLLSRSNNKR